MYKSIFDYRMVRFLLVGMLNSMFGFCVFSAVVWLGQGTVAALLAGNVAGLVFNFFSTGGLVFRTLALTRLPKFLVCYVLMLFMNYGLLAILAPVLDSKILAQAILTVPMASLSYLLLTFWVYKPSAGKTVKLGD